MMRLNNYILMMVLLLWVICFQPLLLAQQSLAYKTTTGVQKDVEWLDWTNRKTKSTWLSAMIPGAGQTYLGHDYKGAAITLGFYGSLLTALLAENNFNGRQDRIASLVTDYKGAGNYGLANTIWSQIQFEKGNRDNDYDRRNLFFAITAVVYLYNIIDIIYLTEDYGGIEFSLAPEINDPVLVNGSTSNYTGLVLKVKLP